APQQAASLLSLERPQARRGIVQRLIALGDAQPQHAERWRLLIKRREGNGGELHFRQQPLRKLQIARRSDAAEIWQMEKSAMSRRQTKRAAFKRRPQPIAFGLKEAGERAPSVGLLGQVARDRILQRMRDAEGVELMHLAQLARQGLRGDAIADADAR